MRATFFSKSRLALLTATLLLAACGDDDPPTPGTTDTGGTDTGGGDVGVDTPTDDTDPDIEPDALADADAPPCDDEDEDGVCDDDDICPGFDDGEDADGDGVPDGCDVCDGDDSADEDEDGVPDDCDVCAGGDDSADADEDGVPDDCDICADGDDATDSDEDGTPDACDLCEGSDDTADADEDGVPDDCDACADADDTADADGDSVPDACDACEGFDDAEDTDEDGVPNGCDVCEGNDLTDGDEDGVPDACDVCEGSDDLADADEDGVPDGCDVCDGGDDTMDGDADGVPDDCDNCPEDENPDQADGDGVWTAEAATIDYALRESPENELTMGDDDVQSVELGFEWSYFGMAVDEIFISSNGFISVVDTGDGCCSGSELPGAPGVIAGYWDDLNPSAGGRVAYGATGEEGAQEFVVAFEDVPHCCGPETPTVSFQIVLRETGGAEVQCESCLAHDGGFIDVATQGVESTVDGISATLEGRNAAAWEAFEDGAEFTWAASAGDGVGDVCDVCPLDSPDDSDEDLVCDSDDICDGFDDAEDSDEDGVPDGCDVCEDGDDTDDTDGDGTPDDCDVCPEDFFDDSDGDGVCDGVDICAGGDDSIDEDGDGTPNFCDACPLDNPDDSDGDGVCDTDDTCADGDDTVDEDGDGTPDFCDACPLDNPDDSDGDGVCDTDDVCADGDDTLDEDGDGTPDFCDACPLDEFDDSDGDGVCDSDDICPDGDDSEDGDGDGVPDFCDNCVEDENPTQLDSDGVWSATAASIEYSLRPSPATDLPMGDDEVQVVPLGFDWEFFGLIVDEVYVSSNGFVSVVDTDSQCCSGDSLPGAPGMIAGYWDDLNPSSTGRVAYGTTGEEGSREFVVAFEGVPHFEGGDSDSVLVSFQIVLRESGGAEVQCASCLADDGGFIDIRATQGVESWRDGVAATLDGRNAALWDAVEDGAEFTWSAEGGDGVGDVCDACPLDSPDDSDGDGVCEGVDICAGGDDAIDTDGDGVPDFCDQCEGFNDAHDDNGDGIPNACDLTCPAGDVEPETGDCLSDCDTDTDGDGVVDCYDLEDGDVVINEFIANPAAVSDSNGEWFELHNPGESPIHLDNAVVSDAGTNAFTIDRLRIPAGGYAVLGRNADVVANGGVVLDYEYEDFTLANTEDEILIHGADGAELDRVEYDGMWPGSAGVSAGYDAGLGADNNVPTNWCESTSTFGAGDAGTPGAENDRCAEFLYVSDGSAGVSGNLYRVNMSTWAVETIGPIGYPVNAMAFAPDGTLYGASADGRGSAPRSLITIDTETGAGTLVANFVLEGSTTSTGIPEMTFLGDVLYAWTESGDDLVRIDTATAVMTRISSSQGSYGTGLAAGPDGLLYLIPDGLNAQLKVVDWVTGAITTLTTLDGGSGTTAKGLVWVGDTLYVSRTRRNDGTVPTLATIDTLTGVITDVAGGPALSTALGAIAFRN